MDPIWDMKKVKLSSISRRYLDIHHPNVSQREEVVREVDGDELTPGVKCRQTEE